MRAFSEKIPLSRSALLNILILIVLGPSDFALKLSQEHQNQG